MSKCRYKPAYSYGNCLDVTISGSEFCEKHIQVKCCSCGAQATKDCCYCGQFVCGYPLCPNCHGTEEAGPSGAWGFLNHSHKRRDRVPHDPAPPEPEFKLVPPDRWLNRIVCLDRVSWVTWVISHYQLDLISRMEESETGVLRVHFMTGLIVELRLDLDEPNLVVDDRPLL